MISIRLADNISDDAKERVIACFHSFLKNNKLFNAFINLTSKKRGYHILNCASSRLAFCAFAYMPLRCVPKGTDIMEISQLWRLYLLEHIDFIFDYDFSFVNSVEYLRQKENKLRFKTKLIKAIKDDEKNI